jgi:hypothetical protein
LASDHPRGSEGRRFGPQPHANQLAYIYDELYQVGVSTNTSDDGDGLGMSIEQRLVKLLNLNLDVHFEVGKDLRFRWYYPRAAALPARRKLGITIHYFRTPTYICGFESRENEGYLRLIQLDGRGGKPGQRPGVFILLCHAVTQSLRLLSRVALGQLRRGRKVRTGGYFCNYHDLKHSEVSSSRTKLNAGALSAARTLGAGSSRSVLCVAQPNHASTLFVPELQTRALEARPQSQTGRTLQQWTGFERRAQPIVRNVRRQMVDMVVANISGKPMQDLWQIIMGAACNCGLTVIP